MPRREDIERFKEVLNSLGSEPAIRAGRSETIEEVAPPEEGLPSDINELLGSFGSQAGEVTSDEEQALSSLEEQAFEETGLAAGTVEGIAEETPEGSMAGPVEGSALEPEGEPAFDLGGLETGEAAVPAAPAGPTRSPSDLEGFDFDSLFGEQGEAPAIEELEKKPRAARREARRQKRAQPDARAPQPVPGEPGTGEPAFGEPAPAEPSADDLPAFEPTAPAPGGEAPAEDFPLDLASDLGSLEIVPEEPAEAGREAGRGEVVFDLPTDVSTDLDESAFEAPTEEPPGAPAGPSSEEPSGEPRFEGLELPGFDEAAKAEAGETRPAAAGGGEAGTAEDLSSLEPLDLGEGFGMEEFPSGGSAEAGDTGSGAAGEGAGGAAEELGGLDLAEFEVPEGPAAPPKGKPAAAAPRGKAPSARPGRAPAAGGPGGLAGRAAKARDTLRGAAARAMQRAAPVAGRIAPRLAAAAQAPLPEELEAAAGPIELTPAQFERLKGSLDSLPRNLKIVVEEIIAAGSGTPGQLAALVRFLVDGATPKDIAALAGRITGKKIRIPAGYEKKTGLAFEQERRTFGYALRENIFPVLRLFVISAVAVGLLVFLGYRFIYRPVSALTNYSRGLSHIEAERYTLANERFGRAVRLWPRRAWYYRYADAFAAKRQFLLAEQKYDELLSRYPGDRKGILDYARMESRSMSNYEKADALLLQLLDKDIHDYDALLAAGDNNLSWADSDPDRFEDARRAYASLIGRYGQKDELLFRMLRYFIRTDKVDEVVRLKAYYADRPRVTVDPEAWAEMGGYLADKGQGGNRAYLDDVPDVLFRALKVRPDLPVIHYNLGRYYRMVGDKAEERKALARGVLPLLRGDDPLTKQRMTIEIDTYTRLGELDYREKAYLDAGKRFGDAIRLVEKYQGAGLLRRERIFGTPYADLGDLQYYVEGRLAEARANYEKAAANGWTEPLLDYKVGYIDYATGSWDAAIGRFLAAEDGLQSPTPPANLLFAVGNAFAQKGDWFAAQGYYLRLRDRLSTRESAIGTLRPEQDSEHRALVELMVKTDNNLGVVMVRLAERTGDRKKKSLALVSFTSAAEEADVLSRNPETLVRSEAKNLPFLNMRGVLYPVSGFELQIYRAIPKDFDALFF
jgi:hypothetical protein